MLSVTKIFHVEMAHAIHGYPGACSKVHGHSYELHVSVSVMFPDDGYILSNGIMFDFRDLKRIVNEAVISDFDHRLLLSEAFVNENPHAKYMDNLVMLEFEPTAENLLLFIRRKLELCLPAAARISRLKLYETKDSYAEWSPAG